MAKLFSQGGVFFKGNTHMHTTCSDGAFTPEQAMALYKAHGYDFIALTDHWICNSQQWHEGMLVLSGVEIDYLDDVQAVHIVGIGVVPERLHLDRERLRARPIQEGIDMLLNAGGRAILAHPAWSLNTLALVQSLRGLSAAEVYNTFSGPPWNANRADSTSLLDMYAAGGVRLPFVAVDDAHWYAGEHCRSFIRVQAEALEREAILAALDQGRFYSSQGPEIHQIELDARRLVISCSAVSRGTFSSNLPWAQGRCRDGSGMTELVYERDLNRRETFIRCELVDDAGNRAWSSPMVWPEE